MRTFFTVWFGQTISLIGSGMTGFGLGLWIYERTGSVTQFALMALCSTLPILIFSPLAGTLIDRWDRRWVMIISDTGAGISTLVLAALLFGGRLEVWHLWVATLVSSTCGTFQRPAYLAAITTLVPRQHLGRSAGMIQLAQAAADIFAPVMTGALLAVIALRGIILIDVATFLFAVSVLFFVRFPRPESSAGQQDSLRRNFTFGWKYIAARPGLAGLLGLFAAVNFLMGMLGVMLVPMMLSFMSKQTLGAVITMAGCGMMGGSLLISAWGGPKRRMQALIGFNVLVGLGIILLGLRPIPALVALGAVIAHFSIPLVSASNQAIWQSKIPAAVQGRVFAAQQMIVRLVAPIAFVIVGPLADGIFEPLMAHKDALPATLFGSGEGRGMALMFVLMGVLMIGIAVVGRLVPRIWLIEDELPDAEVVSPAADAVLQHSAAHGS